MSVLLGGGKGEVVWLCQVSLGRHVGDLGNVRSYQAGMIPIDMKDEIIQVRCRIEKNKSVDKIWTEPIEGKIQGLHRSQFV